jgi:hypothetical protein
MVTVPDDRPKIAVMSLLLGTLLLLFCGKESFLDKPESRLYGNIAPVILCKKGEKIMKVQPDVKKIRLHITGDNIDTSVTAPYSAHSVELRNIPAGIVQLIVDGLDSLDQTNYTDTVSVTIENNKIAEPIIELHSLHPIVLTFTVPKDGDTLANKAVTLSGTIVFETELHTLMINGAELTVNGGQWSKNVDLATGQNIFVFIAIDNIGHIFKDTLTLIYSETAVDKTGPVIVLLQPLDGSTVPVTPVSIAGTVTDPSGILAVQVDRKTATLSGAGFFISADLVPGKNTIVVTATDNSPLQNKSSDTLTVTLNTAFKDTLGPVFVINSPKNGDSVSSKSVMLSGTVLDISGVNWVKVNETAAAVTNNAWTATVPLNAGTNKIVISATDASPQNNASRDSITIVYSTTSQDKTLPSIAITSPSINTVVSNPLNIIVSGTASDPSGITSVKVKTFPAAYENGTWTAVISLASSGSNTIWAVATDGAGNKDSTRINLIYDSTAADNIPPSITLTSHAKGQTVSVSSVLIQATATDANGINWVIIKGDTAANNGGKYERTVSLVKGVNAITVLAQDKSKNGNVDSLVFVLVYDPTASDSIPPKISLVSHTPGQVVSHLNIIVQVTATDANNIAWVLIKGDSATINAGKYEKAVSLLSGLNTIKVLAQDASLKKNIDSLVFTLTCDTTADYIPLFPYPQRP